MEDNKTINPEVSDPSEEGAASSTRTFTQEEVDRIVKARLKKVKDANADAEEEIARRVEEAMAEKTAALEARERVLDCRLYLAENNYPAELLEILDTSDIETFKHKADAAVGLIGRNNPVAPLGSAEATVTGKAGGAIHDAFLNQTQHTPKQWPPSFDN